MTKETIVVLGGADEPQIEWLVKKLAGVKIVGEFRGGVWDGGGRGQRAA